MFKEYQHVARYGTSQVMGINNGTCLVFPKLDGSNGSIWSEDGQLRAGSRRRMLGLQKEKDNHGFYNWVIDNEHIFMPFFEEFPYATLYGEWLIPHTIRDYMDEAWRNFYVFDVVLHSGDDIKYMPYSSYVHFLELYGIDYVPCIGEVTDGTHEQFLSLLEKNIFLMKEGAGLGEGIVIKNYEFVNHSRKKVWAKMVSNEFKTKHVREMGAPKVQGSKVIERKLAGLPVVGTIAEKVYAKINVERGGWESKYIGELLGRVYYDVVTEELYDFLKKNKFPTIDFRSLQFHINKKIRETLPDVF